MVKLLLLFAIGANYPDVTLAQGYVESQMNPFAVGRMKEQGAYQVREKIWGKVPKTIHGQTKQASSILNVLIEENKHSIWKAVKRYNGKGIKSHKYMCKVKRKTLELNLMTTSV